MNHAPESKASVLYKDKNATTSTGPVPSEVSAPIWNRVGLLLALLCLLKLAMLVIQRKYLFQTHWRVGGEVTDWVSYAALFTFALLVAGNVWRLGTRCLALGVKAVRIANAFVLVLAALFIFLTFHEGDKNYLHPIMTGILGWTDLGPYLTLNLFFRPPFLGAWLLAYAAAYYVMLRTGKERRVLRVTAIFGGAYVAICLRELSEYRSALLVADCLGAACLVGMLWNRKPASFWWQLLVPAGAASLFLLFHPFDSKVAEPNPFFQTITGSTVVVVTGLSLLAWRRGIYAAWSWLIPFAFGAFLLLANSHYPMAGNYQNLLCLGLMLPRYFAGEFVIATVLLVAAFTYRRWRPAGNLWWLDIACVCVAVLALLDFKLSTVMGVRLDWDVLAFGDSPKMMWRMAIPYLPSVMGMLALLLGGYIAGVYWLGRRLRRAQAANEVMPLRGWWPVLAGLILLGLMGEWLARPDKVQGQTVALLAQTSPLWKMRSVQAMDRGAFLETAQALGMAPAGTAPWDSRSGPPREMNVVLIFQESTYNKHLSLFGSPEETQPMLSKYKERMELFPRYFTSYAGSIHARFAAFTGLYPVDDFQSFTREHVPVKSLFETLNERGYSCSMFYSSFFDYTSFRDLLKGRGIDEMYDADTMPGERKEPALSWGLREEETLAAIQERIKGYAAGQKKFFLTYVPAAPHYPYDGIPERFRKHRPQKIGDYTPFYLNELLYMDWVVTSIVDELKASGLLESTVVVITGDHGEMLGGDDGAIGHGWAVTPELANVPLIIMNPENPGYHVNPTVGSHVDLLPTVLDILNLPPAAGQIYQGTSLYSADSQRVVYLNSHSQYGIIHDGVFFGGNRDADKGNASPDDGKTFLLANDGAHPFFVETNSIWRPDISIKEFDRFQESFLHHYDESVQMLRTAWPLAGQSSDSPDLPEPSRVTSNARGGGSVAAR